MFEVQDIWLHMKSTLRLAIVQAPAVARAVCEPQQGGEDQGRDEEAPHAGLLDPENPIKLQEQ